MTMYSHLYELFKTLVPSSMLLQLLKGGTTIATGSNYNSIRSKTTWGWTVTGGGIINI